MSDLSEIRQELIGLREIASRTSQDVSWIKEGMGEDRKRSDDQDKRLRSVERRQWWLSGVAAAIGAVLGIGGSHGLKL